MNEPAVIIPRNLADLATMTVDVEPVTGMPLANLKNDNRGRITRWMAESGPITIRGTFNGDEHAFAGVGLDWINLSAGASITVKIYPNEDWTGTPTLNYGPVAPYTQVPLEDQDPLLDPFMSTEYGGFQGQLYWNHWFGTAIAAAAVVGKSFEIIIDDPLNWQGYIDVSRLVLGDAMVLVYNASLGLSVGWKDTTQQEETDGGSLPSNARVPRRAVSGEFTWVVADQRSTLYRFLGYYGKRGGFSITFLAGEGSALERDLTILGAKFTEAPMMPWINVDLHSMPFSIVEG